MQFLILFVFLFVASAHLSSQVAGASMDVNVTVVIPAMTSSSTRGHRFVIEVGYFDTVREIKEKVQRRLGIPAAAQRLFFRNQELADDRGTEHYSILQGSHVLLLVRKPPALGPCPPPAKRARTRPAVVHVTAALPACGRKHQVAVFAPRGETVAALKRRIHRAAEMDAPALERMAAECGDVVMEDDLPLCTYADPWSGVMEVKITVGREPVGTSIDMSERTMAVELSVEGGDTGVLVEVCLSDAVAELRQQLSLLEGCPELPLLAGGDYHFQLGGEAMDEALSLQAHGFRHGDIIAVVSGSVAGAGTSG